MKGLLLSFAAIALSGADAAPEPVAGQETRIPFASRTINNFHAVDRNTIYLETPGQWYRATLGIDCTDLKFSSRIGIDTRGTSVLDRFGAIIVDGQRCPIQSLVKSGPPPREDGEKD